MFEKRRDYLKALNRGLGDIAVADSSLRENRDETSEPEFFGMDQILNDTQYVLDKLREKNPAERSAYLIQVLEKFKAAYERRYDELSPEDDSFDEKIFTHVLNSTSYIDALIDTIKTNSSTNLKDDELVNLLQNFKKSLGWESEKEKANRLAMEAAMEREPDLVHQRRLARANRATREVKSKEDVRSKNVQLQCVESLKNLINKNTSAEEIATEIENIFNTFKSNNIANGDVSRDIVIHISMSILGLLGGRKEDNSPRSIDECNIIVKSILDSINDYPSIKEALFSAVIRMLRIYKKDNADKSKLSVLTQLSLDSLSGITKFNFTDLRSFSLGMQVAGKFPEINLFKEIWNRAKDIKLDRTGYGSALQTAGLVEDVELVKKIWEQLNEEQGVEMDAQTYGIALKAAGKVNEGELLKEIWKQLNNEPSIIMGPKIYGSAMQAAGIVANDELLKEIWNKATNIELEPQQLGIAMQAAGRVNNADLLQDAWNRAENEPIGRQEYGIAMQAAGRVNNADLLKKVWNRAKKLNLETQQYGIAMQAAGLVKDSTLLKKVWDELANARRISMDAQTYGIALQAAGLVEDSALLKKVWSKAKKLNLETQQYGIALQAAGLVKDSSFLKEVWNELLNTRRTNIDVQTYGIALHAAGLVEDGELLKKIWSEAKNKGLEPEQCSAAMQASASTEDRAILVESWEVMKHALGTLSRSDLQERKLEVSLSGAIKASGKLKFPDVLEYLKYTHEEFELFSSVRSFNKLLVASIELDRPDLFVYFTLQCIHVSRNVAIKNRPNISDLYSQYFDDSPQKKEGVEGIEELERFINA